MKVFHKIIVTFLFPEMYLCINIFMGISVNTYLLIRTCIERKERLSVRYEIEIGN